MAHGRRKSTIEVVKVARGPENTVQIDVRVTVDSRRLIDVTAELLRLGVANLQDLRDKIDPDES